MALENGVTLLDSSFGPRADAAYVDESEGQTFDWDGQVIPVGCKYLKIFDRYGGCDNVLAEETDIQEWIDDKSRNFDPLKRTAKMIERYGLYSIDDTMQSMLMDKPQTEIEFYLNYLDCEMEEA